MASSDLQFPTGVAQPPPESYLERWRSLPQRLRLPQQLAGVAAAACGATHSVMEKCNFSCTSCYLSDFANYATPLPFDKVAQQLDELRAYLGEGGKCQITSGEVTLLDKHELGRIVMYARRIGLDPMVMTNGHRLLQVSDYLRTLVEQYGLEKIGLHIDTTQKGRPGLKPSMSEADLDPLRDRFAALIRQVRRQTGRPLHAGTTVTVTQKNFADIPHVVRWVLDNVASVRILSLLPVAEVGRTQDVGSRSLTLDSVWEKVCEGVGRRLNREAMLYGHSECNIVVPLLCVTAGSDHHLVEVVREGRRWDQRVLKKALREFSSCVDLNRGPAWNAAVLAKALAPKPGMLLELALYFICRLWSARTTAITFLWHLATLRRARMRPLLFVVHKFMNQEELETPLGQERLKACVFRLPVEGRMVSMCEMNAGLRREINLAHTGAG